MIVQFSYCSRQLKLWLEWYHHPEQHSWINTWIRRLKRNKWPSKELSISRTFVCFLAYYSAAFIHLPQRVSTGCGGLPILLNLLRRYLFLTVAALTVAISWSTYWKWLRTFSAQLCRRCAMFVTWNSRGYSILSDCVMAVMYLAASDSRRTKWFLSIPIFLIASSISLPRLVGSPAQQRCSPKRRWPLAQLFLGWECWDTCCHLLHFHQQQGKYSCRADAP